MLEIDRYRIVLQAKMNDREYMLLDYNMNQIMDFCLDLSILNNTNTLTQKNSDKQSIKSAAYISSYHTPPSVDENCSPEQLSSDAFFAQNNFVGDNQINSNNNNLNDSVRDFFTPALSTISAFHQRKRSELSSLASPALTMDPYFESIQQSTNINQHSATHQGSSMFSLSTHLINTNISNADAINDNDNDIFNLFFEKPASNFQGLNSNSNVNIKNMDLSSLGIEIKPENKTPLSVAEDISNKNENLNIQEDMNFNINESFIEKLIKQDMTSNNVNNPNSTSLTSTTDVLTLNFLNNINSQQLVQLSQQKTLHIRSPPKTLQKKKTILKKFLEDEMMDEGDTTIINNTTIIEPASAVKQVNDNNNFMNDLEAHESTKISAEVPRLRSFYPKSPTLSSKNKVTKPANLNDSFKTIPVLNENLAFFEAQYSPTKQSFNGNSSNIPFTLLLSPTRNDFATCSSVSSSPIKETPVFLPYQQHQPVIINPMLHQSSLLIHNPSSQAQFIINNGSMISSFPGISMIPPTQVLSPPLKNPYCFLDESPPASPMLHSSPTSSPTKYNIQNGDLKKPFVLKPTTSARKRVATSPRSKTGCWTCRIRHKKCDEGKPICNNCAKINLKCDQFFNPKPDYMKDNEAKKAKLAEIAEIWKNRAKKKDENDSEIENVSLKKKKNTNGSTPLGKSNKSFNNQQKNIIENNLESNKENIGLVN